MQGGVRVTLTSKPRCAVVAVACGMSALLFEGGVMVSQKGVFGR